MRGGIMDVSNWMPAIVAGISAAAPIIGMMVKTGRNKRKEDAVQNGKIDRLVKTVEDLQAGRTENAEAIRSINEMLQSTHMDIKSISAEVREQGVELAKQSFYMDGNMSPGEKLCSGLLYICDYNENGKTSRDVRDFAREHPVELETIFAVKPRYRQLYARRMKEIGE
jgi:formyltetrahydrofolate synthetase